MKQDMIKLAILLLVVGAVQNIGVSSDTPSRYDKINIFTDKKS